MARKNKIEVTIRAMDIDDLSAVYRLGESLFTSEEYPILYRTWDPFEVTGMFTSDPEYCLVAEVDDKADVVEVLHDQLDLVLSTASRLGCALDGV